MLYAYREDLTVAIIGDYNGYNAVMLQAHDNRGWLRLYEELDAEVHVGALGLDTTRVSSLASATIRIDSGRCFGCMDDFDSVMQHFNFSNEVREVVDGMIDPSMRKAMARSPHAAVKCDTAIKIAQQQQWQNGQLVNEWNDTMAAKRHNYHTHR